MAETIEELIELAMAELAEPDLSEALPVLKGSDGLTLSTELAKEPDDEAAVPEQKKGDVRSELSKMRVPLKLKAAMFGNAIVRRILIFDPNRLIQECVLANPQLTLHEIEDFAKNPNMNAQVLRAIAGRSSWMRSYKVKANLVMNPKCPQDLSLKWLKFLNDNEVKLIAKSRNVPQVLQVAAKKALRDA